MYVRNSSDRFQRSLYSEHQADEHGLAAENVFRQPFENILSPNHMKRDQFMELDTPDSVSPVNRTATRNEMHAIADNAYPSEYVYGSTFGNSPLATPSTGTHDQLSMDQYPSFERSSYMSLLKQQNDRDKDIQRQINVAFRRYETATERKSSFRSRWPHHTSVQNIDNLVKYGFFYTGDGNIIKCCSCGVGLTDWSDTVDFLAAHVKYSPDCTGDHIKCFSCGVGLTDWSDAIDPLAAHVRYSPDCQFLAETVPSTLLTRIKASGLPNATVSMRESVDIKGAEQNTPGRDLSSRLNDEVLLSVQPRNPKYRLKSIRISSFSKWPQSIRQTPEELAEAGFFYTGCGDRVRCYVCDGGLQKWCPEDNPWVEHARWFHHCAYVIKVKGQDFVDLVKLSAEHQQLEEEGASGFGTSAHDLQPNKSSEHMCWNNKQNSTETNVEMRSRHEPVTVAELEAETEQLRSVVTCLMCEENDANCLYLPCAHHRLCIQCSTNITECPICLRHIHSKVKTFMS